MAIQDVIKQRAHDAYYGPGAGMEDSPFLGWIMDLFKSLLSGFCPIPMAMAQLNGTPRQQRRASLHIYYEAIQLTGDSEDAKRLTKATMAVGQATSVEEATEYATS